jgi:hypothetical protein
MTPTDSPVLCVTCRQAVPESIPNINYFSGNLTKPTSDDVGCFLDDLRDLTSYLEALFRLLCNMEDSALDRHFLSDCLSLGWELASEARRRQALADDAWTLVEKRLCAAEDSPVIAKEG